MPEITDKKPFPKRTVETTVDGKTTEEVSYDGMNKTYYILPGEDISIRIGKNVIIETFDDMPANSKVKCQIVLNFIVDPL